MLRGNPDVVRTHPLVRGENSWTLRAGGFSELREERYDVILCSNSVRHYPDLALAVALGIPNRVGYAHRGFSSVITHPISITHPQPYPAYFRDMVRQLCGIATGWELKPRIEIAAADHLAAGRFLEQFQKDDAALIACCPLARQERGTWPERFFIEPINTLAGNIPVRILLCGSENQKAELEAIANAIGAPTMVLAGDLSLTAFAAVLSRCNLVFSQDSGPRHLANAVGAPVVFLRNLWFLPEEAGAYCETETDAAPVVPLLKESEYVALQSSVPMMMLAQLLGEKLAYSE